MQISTLVFRKTLEQRERQIVNQCCVPTQSSLKTREAKCNDTTAAGVGSFVIRPTACEPNIAILPFLVPISDSVPFQVVCQTDCSHRQRRSPELVHRRGLLRLTKTRLLVWSLYSNPVHLEGRKRNRYLRI